MIPRKLYLRNFMSYHEPVEVDFRGIHLACLSGDNGNGKSALLDSITWALWGKARTRSDDDLIHMGETEMEVALEFEINRRLYKVVRRREKRGKTGYSFMAVYGHDGEKFSLLSEGVRETEEYIRNLLRMDYDTFINSAFILQGRANEFTTQLPSKRKEILGEILDLGIYSEYEEIVKEELGELKARLQLIEGELLSIEKEVEKEPFWAEKEQEARRLHSRLKKELTRAEKELEVLKKSVRVLEERKKLVDDQKRTLSNRRKDLSEIEEEIESLKARIAEAESVISGKEEIEKSYAVLTQAREKYERMNSLLQQKARLERTLARQEQAIAEAKAALEANRKNLLDKIGELEGELAKRESVEEARVEAAKELDGVAELEKSLEELLSRQQELQQERGALDAAESQIKQEKKSLKERARLLQESQKPVCPVCGSPLTPEHRQKILEDFEAEQQELSERYRQNRSRMKALDDEIRALSGKIRSLQAEIRSRKEKAQRKLNGAEVSLERLSQAAEELEKRRKQLASLEEKLEKGTYAELAQKERQKALASLESLGYSQEEHDSLRQQIESLKGVEDAYAALKMAEERLERDSALLTQREAQAARWRVEIEALQEQIENLEEGLRGLPEAQNELRRKESELKRLENETIAARDELTRARQQLDTIQKQKKRYEELRMKRDELREEIDLYKELQVAFGKKGVQALVIESALPEIQAEANQLLSRMTGGRMSLTLETQRETKKGEPKETLDVIISDELGPRKYELFSGGEAFRVDFALRVALSKVLARRAGAQLQTLVIDEGFGSQDAVGRQRLVEAINAIKDDFALILVITHIEELRDLFQVRIDVTKDRSGSHVEIVG